MPYLNNFCPWGDILPNGHPVLLLVEHRQIVVHVHQVHHHLGAVVIVIEIIVTSAMHQHYQ